MASSWQKIGELALDLKKRADKVGDMREHFHRCAYSRYYYSVFHRARDWAEDQSPPLARRKPKGSTLGTHERVWDYLAKKTGIEAFDLRGNIAHRRRCNADYELLDERGLDFDPETFEDSWMKVTRFGDYILGSRI